MRRILQGQRSADKAAYAVSSEYRYRLLTVTPQKNHHILQAVTVSKR